MYTSKIFTVRLVLPPDKGHLANVANMNTVWLSDHLCVLLDIAYLVHLTVFPDISIYFGVS